MAIFRQYIAPFIVVLVFLIALVAVSARIFLPTDMAAPAPVEEVNVLPEVTSGSYAKDCVNPQPEHAQLPTLATETEV